MSTHFLHLPRKTYYYRSVVPKHLRRLLNGREQIWRSLKTADKDEAQARSAAWHSRFQYLFLALRRHGDRMTNEQREALVTHWLEVELDEAEDARTLAGTFSDEYRYDVSLLLSDQFQEANEALLTNNWRKVEKEADELLKAAGLSALDHDGAEFGRLCRRLLLAKQEYLRIEADRWEGKYTDNHVHKRSVGATTAPTKPKTPAGPLFSTVSEKYMAEMPRADRSAKPLKAEFLKFLDAIGGDKPVTAITKADGRTYKEHLLNERKLSMLTVSKHLSAVTSVFRWAQQQGYVSAIENPIQGLAPSKRIVKKLMGKRRPFTDEELLKVFGSPEFIKQRELNPSRYWLCLICLLTCCRREEAGQLALVDLQEEEGIPLFRINDDEKLQQVLKNESSRRRVPIHSALLKLGFLDLGCCRFQRHRVRCMNETGGEPWSDESLRVSSSWMR